MSKRPSVFGGMNLSTDEVQQLEPKVATAPAAIVDKDKEKSIVKTSTYLPVGVHEVLREIAFHERTKVHDLLLEGIEHVLKSRRHPSISELRGRA